MLRGGSQDLPAMLAVARFKFVQERGKGLPQARVGKAAMASRVVQDRVAQVAGAAIGSQPLNPEYAVVTLAALLNSLHHQV